MDVSFQLYSARENASWEGVLKMLGDLGYTQVEGFGGVYGDPAAFRAAMDANGLTMPSGHFFPPAMLEDDFDASIETARTLGIERIFIPALPPEERAGDAAHWTAVGQRLAAIGRRVTGAGFRFGWHNHDFEFAPLRDGPLPMEIILTEAPEIEWEADIAWIVRGRQDPLDWIERFGDRITAAHVKDIAPAGENADEDGWADVGHGTMDWPGILKALRARGVDLFVLEHDKPSDAQRFAERSIQSFKSY